MQWHTPIGYKVLNGKIVVYEEHRKIVEQIFRDYDSGISALRIAKDLKDRGIKNVHDRVGWSHVFIGRILENYNYLGTEDYEQIIDKELFERVQKRREQVRVEGSRGKHRPNKRERLIFSGVLICAECGCPYSHIQPNHKKERYGVPKWKCKNYVYQNRVSCGGGFISDSQVEEVCIIAINKLIQSPGLTEKYEKKEQQVSPEYRRITRCIEESEDIGADEMMALLFRQASERYKTLEVRDEDIKAEKMRETLAGREEIEEFDEELYRKLIKQIVVYKDDSVRVIFPNNNSIRIGYRDL
jgi:site-specific DNA recombinase